MLDLRHWVQSGHEDLLCVGFRTWGPASCRILDAGLCFGSGLGRQDPLRIKFRMLGSALCWIWDSGICSASSSGHGDLLQVGFVALYPGMRQTHMGTGAIPGTKQPQTLQGSAQRLGSSLSVHHNSAWYCSDLKTSLGCMKMPSITFQ